MTLAVFLLNVCLFILFSAMSLARYLLFPGVWQLMIRHPVQSLYISTMPMGATTLLNVAVNLVNEDYSIGGQPFLYTIWALWWLDVAISVVCCWGMVHYMETAHTNHKLENMTTVWLLPVVTLIVASSSGGILASALQKYSPSHALLTITVCVVMVTIGLSLALMMLTFYLLRLIVFGLPPGATIISVFLPLGPTGQAGYSILLIGQFFKSTLPLDYGNSEILRLTTTGETIDALCVCVAFVLWSLASMWFIFAVLGIHTVLRKTRIAFKVPFWGLIFPNGVYANLTIALSRTFDSKFFRVWGSIYAVATLLMWIFVAFRTIVMVYSREIFEAPCLEDADIALSRRTMIVSQEGKDSNKNNR